MNNIPFNFDIYEGFGEVEGLIKIQDEAVVLEYRSKDGVFGVIKTELKTIRIPFEEVRTIQYKKGLIGGKIILEVNNSSLLEEMPGSEPGRTGLNLKRRIRSQGQSFAKQVAWKISDYLQMGRV